MAAYSGEAEVTRLLLAKGARPDDGDELGVTALMAAASEGHTAVAKVLIENGADAEARTSDDRSALMMAAAGNHVSLMRLLIANGARVDATDSARNTPLSNAAWGGQDAAVDLLLAEGAEVRTRDVTGRSAADVAAAGAAAGALLGLDGTQARYLLSYCAQLASGCTSNVRDQEHIEKAFDFAGMPAQAGVMAATMVAAGFTGVDDVFSGERNFFDAYSPRSRIGALAHGLGRHYEITDTNIKRWTVGSPMQAALDSLEWLMAEKGITAKGVRSVAVHLPTRGSRTVDNAPMPNINAQHLVSLMLTDGTLSFASSHDGMRMMDPALKKLRARVRVVPSDALMRARPHRQAIVEITTRDGRTHKRRTRAVRGSADNPMTWDEVAAKARGLMDPVLGAPKARRLVDAVRQLDALDDAARLRPLLATKTEAP